MKTTEALNLALKCTRVYVLSLTTSPSVKTHVCLFWIGVLKLNVNVEKCQTSR